MKPKVKKPVPYSFVLDELRSLDLHTKPMFGAHGVYIGNKIVFILRRKDDLDPDNGVWIATLGEHHKGLQLLFPHMRSIAIFGPGPTGWQILPETAPDFEESVIKACNLVLKSDPKIGKIPKVKIKSKKTKPTKPVTRGRK